VITAGRDRAAAFAALTRPSGAMALVALDQRESLRAMLADRGLPAGNAALEAFKVRAVGTLAPAAAGVLLDPAFGCEAMTALPPGRGLIVAADRIAGSATEVVATSAFDERLDLGAFAGLGAVACKLLVLWRAGEAEPADLAMVERFIERCLAAGVLSLVEGIVRVGRERPEAHADLVLEAARNLGALGPDVYKAEVPTLGRGSAAAIEAASEAITDALACPWVVLSNGTPPDAFPDGLAAAMRGGASGFLAGRAIWAPAVSAATSERDLVTRLAADALPRLQRIVAIADLAIRQRAIPGVSRPSGGA
jgi:sulfofructosephosphate aldolase